MTSVSQLAKENMRRCAEILECEEKIRFYQSRLTQLQKEHRRVTVKASLKADAYTAWSEMTENEKWAKENLLAALQNRKLPFSLQGESWETSVPDPLRHDRDLFLARLERGDILEHYSYHSYTPSKLLVLPPQLKADKEVILKVLKAFPSFAEENALSPVLLEDIEFAHAFLRLNAGSFAENASKFSESIRGNRELMLESLEAAHSSPMLFRHLGPSLRSDRNFILQAADVTSYLSSCALEDLPNRLRADKEIVLAIVKKNGENFHHASNKLKNDRDVVVAAISSGSLLSSSIPEGFQIDRQFWKDLLPCKPTAWNSMPPNLQQDRELAIIAVRNFRQYIELGCWRAEDILGKIVNQCPGVVHDRESAMNIARTYDGLRLLISANAEFARDRDIALQACRSHGRSLNYVDASLLGDRDIIQAALESRPTALRYVPDFVQRMYPDLVVQAIRDVEVFGLDLLEIYQVVDEEMWANPEVALAWVSQGGEYLDEFHPDFAHNKELFLLYAEHDSGEFRYASDALRGDKDYMLQAVEKDGRLLHQAAGELSRDYDLVLVALAGKEHGLDKYRHMLSDDVCDCDCNCFRFLAEFAAYVRSRLFCHEGFVKSILCGTASHVSPDRTTTILDQGQETSMQYKKLIAEYVGIPMGKELRLLRQASRNLERWGY